MSTVTEAPQIHIPVAKPTMTGDEMELLQQVINSGWVSQGPLTAQFEERVSAYTGAPYCVATTSWTTAFHLAMLIHGIGPGDEVICPSYSFIATANVIRHAGGKPVFADIDPATLNIDPKYVEKLLKRDYYTDSSGKTRNKTTGFHMKAIMIVHQFGMPADIDAFAEIAKKQNVLLLEDSACAIGSTYKNQPIGSSGFTGAFSFHPRKVITTGEGGMLLLHDEELAAKAKVLRAHGMSISDLARHQAGCTVYESYESVGYNYRLTDLQSALGLKQMDHLDNFIDRRRWITDQYNGAFWEMPELTLVQLPDYVSRWNGQTYTIRLNNKTQEDRDNVMRALEAQGIATRRGIPPIHLEPAYQPNKITLPQTQHISQTSIVLPVYPGMHDEQVHHVIHHVKEAVWAAQ